MKRSLKLFLLASLVILSSNNFSHSQEILTLEEAIRIGLEKNYEIKIAENDDEVLKNNFDFAKYSFLPTIGAVANKNFDVEDTEQQRFNDSLPSIVDGARSNQLIASVNLEWTIFDGFGMFIAYERLEELRKAGEFNLKATIEQSIAEISQAYYQIILEKEKIEVFRNTLELSERRLEISKAIFEVGRSSKLEYLSAQVDYNTDISALINQEELLYQSKVNLNRIIGRKINEEFEVADIIKPNENLSLETLEEDLLRDNPNLLVLKSNKNASKLETKQIHSERFPEINFNAGYAYSNQESQVGFANYFISSGYYYGLSATLNIFNGFDINRRVQNAKINEETREIYYNQLYADLLANLNNTYIVYSNALRLVKLESENLKIAKESEGIAYDRYKLGNANFLELREAQRNAVEAESRLLNAEYNTKMAEIELLRLSGQLLESNRK